MFGIFWEISKNQIHFSYNLNQVDSQVSIEVVFLFQKLTAQFTDQFIILFHLVNHEPDFNTNILLPEKKEIF